MIIVANWKAKVETVAQAKKLVTASKKIADSKKHNLIVAPSAPHLGLLAYGTKTKLAFASQDISQTAGTAQTGEVTGKMLVGVGVTYVIIGHSERRALGDTQEILVLKLRNALASRLIPIVCIGEHERDVEAHYLSVLRTQITQVLTPLSAKDRAQIIFAYEPLWAIGKQASLGIQPEDLNEMVSYIRKVLSDFLPGKASEKSIILYGGAVEQSNAKALTHDTGINGLLVGHASSDATSFMALAKALG